MSGKFNKRVFALLVAVLLVFTFSATATAKTDSRSLIPGGMAFGIKFFTDGCVVIGTTGVESATGVSSPAKDVGLQAGDIIIRAGGREFETAEELVDLISGCGGRDIAVVYIRDGKENKVDVTPVRDNESGKYRIGVLVRDSTAGIGTVTFIDPKTNDFGGLGHGVYDSESAILLQLARGAVVNVTINEVIKSYPNAPGELRGSFDNIAVGELWDNSEQGVFGSFTKVPATDKKPIPIAGREEITEGKATVLTTLDGGGIGEYGIEIEKIYKNSGNVKNFLIHVTDQALLDRTGGIVQGMSGSPIIQNGKLVGAVTHVLVNDPTRGYGIFIENMLETAYGASVGYYQIAA
jgi:stage IV sporulation protein B